MKKIFKVSSALMGAFLCFLGASCSSNDNELSVTSFKADSSSYNEGDMIEFTLTLNNPQNYKIEAAVINDKSYTVSQAAISTKTFKVSDKDLVFSHDAYRYTLSKIVYTVNGEQKILEVKNKALVLTEKATKIEDVVVKNISIKSLTNPDAKSVYQQDDIEATIEVERKDNVRILYFYFTLTDETGQTKEVKKAYNDDGKSKIYTVNFTMPAMAGSTEVKLSNLDYVLGTARKDKSLDAKTNCNVLIQPLSLNYVRVSKNSGFSKDVNELQYFDSSSQVDIEIKLDNPSNLTVTGLTICGQLFNLSKSEISTDTQFKTVTIKKKLNLSAIKTNPVKLTIDKISYLNDNGNALAMSAELTDDIYYYDKIIKSVSDLKSIKFDENGNITGNYILGADLTVDLKDVDIPFFKDYNFAGKLEGNGHKIVCSSTTRPLFKTTSNNALIQNLSLNIGATSTEFLCETNNGTIKNIKLGGSETLNKDESAILCYKNTGDISNIEFLTALDGNASLFSIIMDNSGSISNVIINPQSLKLGKNLFVASPAIDTGSVSNFIFTLEKWFTGVNAGDYKSQNSLVINKTDDATYSNLILNNNWIKEIDSKNKIIAGPNASVGHNVIVGKLNELWDAHDQITNNTNTGSFEIEKYILGKSYDNTDSAKFRATLLDNDGFTSQYYATLGFSTYNTSNNAFWRLQGRTMTLNWTSK